MFLSVTVNHLLLPFLASFFFILISHVQFHKPVMPLSPPAAPFASQLLFLCFLPPVLLATVSSYLSHFHISSCHHYSSSLCPHTHLLPGSSFSSLPSHSVSNLPPLLTVILLFFIIHCLLTPSFSLLSYCYSVLKFPTSFSYPQSYSSSHHNSHCPQPPHFTVSPPFSFLISVLQPLRL